MRADDEINQKRRHQNSGGAEESAHYVGRAIWRKSLTNLEQNREAGDAGADDENALPYAATGDGKHEIACKVVNLPAEPGPRDHFRRAERGENDEHRQGEGKNHHTVFMIHLAALAARAYRQFFG